MPTSDTILIDDVVIARLIQTHADESLRDSMSVTMMNEDPAGADDVATGAGSQGGDDEGGGNDQEVRIVRLNVKRRPRQKNTGDGTDGGTGGHSSEADCSVTFELLHRVTQLAPLYYAQRTPDELAAFRWVVDAKDPRGATDWERWWAQMVLNMLQERSKLDPMPMMVGADWSAFDRFLTEWPAADFPNAPVPDDGKVIDINKIMREHFAFSSGIHPGLELVDILTNGLRRALVGNLEAAGWAGIPRLMIHHGGRQYFQLITMEQARERRVPYATVVAGFRTGGRSLLTRSNLEAARREEHEPQPTS